MLGLAYVIVSQVKGNVFFEIHLANIGRRIIIFSSVLQRPTPLFDCINSVHITLDPRTGTHIIEYCMCIKSEMKVGPLKARKSIIPDVFCVRT